MFRLKDISYSYPNGKPIEFPDMTFQKGEEWLVLGPSGCGKTTLLHLMAGLLRCFDGDIELNGQSFSSLNGSSMDRFRGQNMGIIFQSNHLIKSLTALDNVMLSQNLAKKKKSKQTSSDLLRALGLSERLHHTPSKLSIGEQQRVSIARAVINNPTVILADEPTSALDDENALKVLQVLREQAAKRQSTLIIVTHDQRLKDAIKNTINLGHA